MVKYLVTTRLEVLEKASSGCQVFMVDGTVPGWLPESNADDSCGDYHFDHHEQGGEDIQIDEMPPSEHLAISPDLEGLIVTTQVDADACVAAAYLQLKNVSQENLQKLRAIAYDCDHLGVPSELLPYAEFASNCVAAMKANSDNLIKELGLPEARQSWTIEQKEAYSSLAFERGTQSLIESVKGERKFPGECGEAKPYWERQAQNTERLLNENRVTFYKDCLLVDYKGWKGQIDPRCALRAYEWLYNNYGHKCKYPITLSQREVYVKDEFKGWSYTLGCIPSHTRLELLDYTNGVFEALTKAERELNPNAEGWGGRRTVGGSGWNTPSQLLPQQIIDIALDEITKNLP